MYKYISFFKKTGRWLSGGRSVFLITRRLEEAKSFGGDGLLKNIRTLLGLCWRKKHDHINDSMLTINLEIDDKKIEQCILEAADFKGISVEQLIIEIIEDYFKKSDREAGNNS